MEKKHIKLHDLEVYRLAQELSKIGWEIYSKLDWQDKKTMGDQFIAATDSFGANVAEGYGRYHYLDKIKFFYNARGSLAEAAEHWLVLLEKRGKVSAGHHQIYGDIARESSIKLQNLISAVYRAKSGSEKR